MTSTPPSIYTTAFNCPHCGAFAHQEWFHLRIYQDSNAGWAPGVAYSVLGARPSNTRIALTPHVSIRDKLEFLENAWLSFCAQCKVPSVWLGENLIHPSINGLPLAAADMPDEVKELYDEAASVFPISPRAAAALIRLSLETLCSHLNAGSGTLNQKIGNLVSAGLSEDIQRALDSIRIIGNEGVHPGLINLNEEARLVASAFSLVNLIVDDLITRGRRVQEIYDALPESARDGVRRRDGASQG